jgi:UDP-N-acetyl-2-amino-2-deoxyglucuronate dehydrogenase
MLNFGIIGLGVIGKYHLNAALKLDNARVQAVCDLRGEVAEATAREHGIEEWTASPSELLANKKVDAVILALPTGARAGLGLEAFRAGKHVLLEKPVAMNTAEADGLLAARGDLVGACCSSRFRSLESAAAARTCIEAGTLGEIRVIGCRVHAPAGPPPASPPPAWRLSKAINGGGILMNWGVYDLDYLLGLLGFGLEPRHVLARTWQVPYTYAGNVAPGSDGETHVAAMVTFRSGAVLQYERSEYGTQAASQSWSIAGDKGSLTLKLFNGREDNVILGEADYEKGTQIRTLWSGDETSANFNAAPVADFVAAIREGRAPRTSLADARQVAVLTDAIYASAASGGPVSFS